MLISISMELSILYLKGSEFHIKCISFIHGDFFILATLRTLIKCNLIQHYIRVYTVCQSTGHQYDNKYVYAMIICLCTEGANGLA